MRSALTKAASQGFVWPDSDITESLGPSTPVNEDIDRQSVIDMVFALKKEHANIHVGFATDYAMRRSLIFFVIE